MSNYLNSDLIYPGQELLIPEQAEQAQDTVTTATLPSLEENLPARAAILTRI